mmetsp:Transcript_14998/g.35736  ORF Transcript_14998/g.35736 Transcript_14998/m.35736 type:complete len:414 (+) Transcript_14998:1092-2333(+)
MDGSHPPSIDTPTALPPVSVCITESVSESVIESVIVAPGHKPPDGAHNQHAPHHRHCDWRQQQPNQPDHRQCQQISERVHAEEVSDVAAALDDGVCEEHREPKHYGQRTQHHSHQHQSHLEHEQFGCAPRPQSVSARLQTRAAKEVPRLIVVRRVPTPAEPAPLVATVGAGDVVAAGDLLGAYAARWAGLHLATLRPHQVGAAVVVHLDTRIRTVPPFSALQTDRCFAGGAGASAGEQPGTEITVAVRLAAPPQTRILADAQPLLELEVPVEVVGVDECLDVLLRQRPHAALRRALHVLHLVAVNQRLDVRAHALATHHPRPLVAMTLLLLLLLPLLRAACVSVAVSVWGAGAAAVVAEDLVLPHRLETHAAHAVCITICTSVGPGRPAAVADVDDSGRGLSLSLSFSRPRRF